MGLIAGVDTSTQSTKVEIRDAASGEVVGSGSAPHPVVTPPVSEQDPLSWWAAFQTAWEQAGGPDIDAISVGGQQHGMVAVDADGDAVHPAKLWNDMESADDAAELVARLGDGETGAGARNWADAVGSVPVGAFTITKLAWLRRTRPDAWAALDRVMLPHDWLTSRLTGNFTTDRGDASGTGYWSPATGTYRHDLLALVDADRDWTGRLPMVLGPMDRAGEWNGAVVAPGSGDNMAGALGIGLRAGDVAISIGTSGTVYAVTKRPTADPTGIVAGFADATGHFLPLVCTSNAAKVLDAVRNLIGADHAEFDSLALSVEAEAPVLLPYFDGERTPNRPDATGTITGLRTDITRDAMARAAVDGVVCGLLDGLDAVRDLAAVDGRIVLTGGGARSEAIRRVLAGLVDLPVIVSEVPEAVATGAAVQAAAVAEQVEHEVIQQRWGLGGGATIEPAPVPPGVRERYADLRGRMA